MKTSKGSVWMVGMVALGMVGLVRAADVNVSADLASSYIFRGATMNEDPVVQPGVTISGMKIGDTVLPVTLGSWGNFDLGNYDGKVENGEFSEVDLFGSIALPKLWDPLAWSIGYTEYLYPSSGADTDREFNLVFTGEDPYGIAPYASINYGVDGLLQNDWYLELGVAPTYKLTDDVTLGAGASVSAKIQDDGAADGFNAAVFNVSASYKIVKATLGYVCQMDDDVLPDGPFGYDREWFAKVGVNYTF